MAISTEKVRNMLLFFVKKMSKITSIQLQLAMLLADRIHWALYTESISGLEYVKGEYCPVMEKEGWSILTAMDKADLHVSYEYKANYTRIIRTTEMQADMSVFSPAEIETLHKSYDIVNSKKIEQLSKMTHDDAWECAGFGDVLPYKTYIDEETEEQEKELTYDEVLDREIKDIEELMLQIALEKNDYSTLKSFSNRWI